MLPIKKKVVPALLNEHNAMKAYWGNVHILGLGTRWSWVVSFTPRPLYPQGESPWYPLDRRLAEPPSRSGRCGEEKNPQPLLGLESPIIQPVARRYTAELSQILCYLYTITFVWLMSYAIDLVTWFFYGTYRIRPQYNNSLPAKNISSAGSLPQRQTTDLGVWTRSFLLATFNFIIGRSRKECLLL
jgi:hypothetical protein